MTSNESVRLLFLSGPERACRKHGGKVGGKNEEDPLSLVEVGRSVPPPRKHSSPASSPDSHQAIMLHSGRPEMYAFILELWTQQVLMQ